MKRYIIVLPDGREVVFYGDVRGAWLFACAYGGTVKEDEAAGGGEGSPSAAEGDQEEGTKPRRKR